MFFVDLPSTRKKNKDINPGSNNANDHIPKATVQLRYLNATSTSCYIFFMADVELELFKTTGMEISYQFQEKAKKILTFLPLIGICHI